MHPIETIYVVWDNADTHEDDEVETGVRVAARRLILMYLAEPLVRDSTPLRCVFRRFQREVTHCELFGTKQALVAAAQDFFDCSNQCPQKILSVIDSKKENKKRGNMKQDMPLDEHFLVPELYCPFSSATHPHLEEIESHTLQWARQFRLIGHEVALQRFRASRFAWLAARTHPFVGLDEVLLVSDLYSWIFLFDDQFDRGQMKREPARVRETLDALASLLGTEPTQAENPLAVSLADLWQRSIQLFTPMGVRHLRKGFIDYFDAFIWEVHYRAQRSIPHIEEYRAYCAKCGATSLWFHLL